MPESPTAADAERERIGPRIDTWLWRARFFKTRTLASRLCNGGRLRVNGDPIAKAHYRVRRGDVLTFPQGGRIRAIEVRAFGLRRGPAAEAQTLYEDLDADLAPPAPQPAPTEKKRDRAPAPPHRDSGAGRPTKAERRAIGRLRGRP